MNLWRRILIAGLALVAVSATSAASAQPPADESPTPGTAPAAPRTASAATTAQAAILPAEPVRPFITATGSVSVSVDAIGTNSPNGGLVTVEKPPGATVRQAFLLAATTGFTQQVPQDGDINLGGVDISWDAGRTMANGISSFNAFANVTGNVKNAIDAAAAGPVNFRITEAVPSRYDGAILAVIFDDPSIEVPTTAILAYGAQQVTGDRIRLARPAEIPTEDVEVRLGVGISYGFQPAPNVPQDSRINVNGIRLTSSAGGQDDGEGQNGALITVGGVGDDLANPTDPFADGNSPGCPRCDDEYYDLQPFLSAELVDELELTTQNPSADDNFFFAALEVVGATATWTSSFAGPSPLVVLHGITGSYLEDADGNEIWPDEGQTADKFEDNHLDVLALDENGVDPADPNDQISVSTSRGIDGLIGQSELCTPIFCKNIGDAYNLTFNLLEDEGYERGEDLFPFAFDWRLSTKTNGDLLIDFIDEILAETGASSVNILAHSQGGLVTRNAVESPRSVGKVDRVVTFGTPYLGSPKFVGVLDYREPCQAEVPFGGPGCFLARAKAQELATNWPGALELLPSRAFFDTYGSVINRDVDDDGDGTVEGLLPFDDFRDTLADRNLTLIDAATALHQTIDPWDPADDRVELLRLAGTGETTILRIRQFQKEDCLFSWFRNCELVEAFEFEHGDGDGTVPTSSASLIGDGLDLSGDARVCYISGPGAAHGKLPQRELAMGIALDWVEDGEYTCGQEASRFAATTQAASRAAAAAPATTTASSEPARLTATELVARGPITGYVERLGTEGAEVMGLVPDGDDRIEINSVVNGSYYTAPESVSYSFNGAGDYLARWEMVDDGEFALLLRTYDGGIASVRSVLPIRLPAGATMTLALSHPSPTSVVLRIDENGDGTVDRELPVEDEVVDSAAQDTIAPTSTVTLIPVTGDPGSVEVEITAVDLGGSGVGVIEYALEPEGISAVYEGPFTVPATGTLHVRSIDRAGNVEAPAQVLSLSLDLCQSPTIVADGSAIVIGTEGDDVILGTDGPERIEGLGGNDVICGEGGNDVIYGGPGDDVLDGGANSDRVFGGGGDDVITDPSGQNLLHGQGGNDVISGGGSIDLIFGAGGRDVLKGFAGDDVIDGGRGGDTIDGGAGDDRLSGGPGNDRVRDAAGDDRLDGNGGNDRLTDLQGTNRHDGGDGNDRCRTGATDVVVNCE